MKRRLLFILATLGAVIFSHCLAQDESYKNECRAHFSLEDSIPSMNFDEFLARNIVYVDNGADATTLCIIEFDVTGNGRIDNVNVTTNGNVEFVENAVREAVNKSEQYWMLDSSVQGNRVKMQFKYKWIIK